MKFFRFFRTLLVIANNMHSHSEVLLFRTGFDMYVLFVDVKTETIGSSCFAGISSIAIFSEHKQLQRFVFQKEEELLP